MYAYENNLVPDAGGRSLLIIDPQRDFHPMLEGVRPEGSLAVPGANEDAKRIASLIKSLGSELKEIYVTLDSHQMYHIAHSLFWKDSYGKHPAPFTQISLVDVKSGKYIAVNKEHQKWAEHYVTELGKKSGKFDLTIWPNHCLLDSPGHAVVAEIRDELIDWEVKNSKAVHYVMKGTNSLTEHYSALRAEVIVADDERTKLNMKLIKQLRTHKQVLICGQALSHCVNWTTRDLSENWPSDEQNKLVLLDDASSTIPGYEDWSNKLIDDMKAKGVRVMKVNEALKEENQPKKSVTGKVVQRKPSKKTKQNVKPRGNPKERGCYLILPADEKSSVTITYANSAPADYAMFYSSSLIPKYKFTAQKPRVGNDEQLRGAALVAKRCHATLQYLKEAANVNAAITLQKLEADIEIFACRNNTIIPIRAENTGPPVKLTEYDAIAVVPKKSQAFKGKKTIKSKREFLREGLAGGSFDLSFTRLTRSNMNKLL